MANSARPLPKSRPSSSAAGYQKYAAFKTPEKSFGRNNGNVTPTRSRFAATPSASDLDRIANKSEEGVDQKQDMDMDWEYRQPMYAYIPQRLPVLGVAAWINLYCIRFLARSSNSFVRNKKNKTRGIDHTDVFSTPKKGIRVVLADDDLGNASPSLKMRRHVEFETSDDGHGAEKSSEYS